MDKSKEEIINDVLESMLNVDGLDGALAISPEGDLLGAVMPGVYDYESLTEVAGNISNTIMTLRELKIRPTELCYRFEGIRLIVSDLRKGFLLTMSQTNISAPLLNIATNVTRKKLTKILADQAAGKAGAAPVKRMKSTKAKPVTASSEQVAVEPAKAVEAAKVVESVRSTSFDTTGSFLILNEEENQLPARQLCFMLVIRQLLQQVEKKDATAVTPVKEALIDALSKTGVHAAMLGVVQQWLSSPKETLKADLSEKQMCAVVHGIYILLCEYFGPVACDQMTAQCMRVIHKLPVGEQYSPNKLFS